MNKNNTFKIRQTIYVKNLCKTNEDEEKKEIDSFLLKRLGETRATREVQTGGRGGGDHSLRPKCEICRTAKLVPVHHQYER